MTSINLKLQKHTNKSTLIALLAAAVVVIAVAITVISQWSSLSALLDERAARAKEYEALKSELQSKEEYLEYVGSDAYYMEKAREILGWVRDGEVRYIFTNGEEAAQAQQAE